MTTAAIRIHALARSLGVQKAEVVGHDIGLMVAYYALRSRNSGTASLANREIGRILPQTMGGGNAKLGDVEHQANA